MPKASKHKLYTLPSNFNEMNKFIEVNKIEKEQYELCIRVKSVESKLNSILDKITHEKKEKPSKKQK